MGNVGDDLLAAIKRAEADGRQEDVILFLELAMCRVEKRIDKILSILERTHKAPLLPYETWKNSFGHTT